MERMLNEFAGKPVRAFVIWEPVLLTDFNRPSTAAMARVPDPRAAQFWDAGRLISHQWGEHGRKSIVWDDVSVYAPGVLWQDTPPQPLFRGKTVVGVEEQARAALARALAAGPESP